MTHSHLSAILGSAFAHLLHPHGLHQLATHPFAAGVRPVGGDTELAAGVDAYAVGKRRLESKDALGALAAFRQALANDPSSIDALDGLAVSWDTLGRPDLARFYYEEALARSPDSPNLANNLGYSYYLAGDQVKARSLLTRAAAGGDPRVAEAARQTLEKLASLDQAEAQPTEPARTATTANSEMIVRVSATRQALTTTALASPRADAWDRTVRTAAFVERPTQEGDTVSGGRHEREFMLSSAAYYPDSAEPPPRLTLVKASQSDSIPPQHPVFDSDDQRLNAFAAEVYSSARIRGAPPTVSPCDVDAGSSPSRHVELTVPPRSLPARLDAALSLPSLAAADDLIQQADGVLPPPLLTLYKAEISLRSGQVDEAALSFARLTEDPSVAARAWAGLGSARLRRGQVPSAITALDRSLELDPTRAPTWVLRGVAADMARDWPAAETAYGRAIARDPKSFLAVANRGYSRLLRGRYKEALDDLQHAKLLDPQAKSVQTNLRIARVMVGDYKGASAQMAKDNLPEDLNTMGFAAMSRGDYDQAEMYFTRAIELNPRFDHAAWDNLTYLKHLVHANPSETGVH